LKEISLILTVLLLDNKDGKAFGILAEIIRFANIELKSQSKFHIDEKIINKQEGNLRGYYFWLVAYDRLSNIVNPSTENELNASAISKSLLPYIEFPRRICF
jgi:hypothetical protein